MGIEHRARESAPARYRPRRSSRSVLYRCVQEHLETWLAQCREGHDDDEPVPEYVEREFRRYLECGLLACGLARARCGQCRHDFPLVCPLCGANMRVIAFITDAAAIPDILVHLGKPTAPPRSAPARGPPLWETADTEHEPTPDPALPPTPAFEFDQRLNW